jgi:hypothetical protein
MAAWLSVNMTHFLGVIPVVCMSSAMCRASTSPLSSAAYTVEVADVPMYWVLFVPIMLAFRNGFEEAQKGVYTFQDTSAGTLGRSIEWAYTGNYPTVLNAYSPVQSETKRQEMLRIKLWKTDVRRTLRLKVLISPPKTICC